MLSGKQQAMEQSNKKTNIRDKDGNLSLLDQYLQKIRNVQICPFLVQCLAIDKRFDTDWMVQLDDNYKQNSDFTADSLIGQTNILIGPALSGKMGLVYWKTQQLPNFSLIHIDCIYHSTPHSFIRQLVQQLAIILQKSYTKKSKSKAKDTLIPDSQQLSKKIVIENNINLSALNDHIRSKPHHKFLFVVRNAEVLVEFKKQTILYNFFQWIKTDIRDQIGLVLITRNLSFVDKLEKRVKSRMNAKIIPVFGVRSQKIIKQAIIKRFQYGLLSVQDDNMRKTIKKLIQLFQRSIGIQKILKKQVQHSTKSITFFLQVFKLIFSIKINDNILNRLISLKDFKQFQNSIQIRFQQAKLHLRPYAEQQQLILRQMSIPQFIIMAIIRKMLIDAKPKISFKEIKKQIALFKQNHYHKSGSSFELPDNLFQRSIRALHKLTVIEMHNKHDIENADIISNMEPNDIKDAIEGRDDLPEYLKDLLN